MPLAITKGKILRYSVEINYELKRGLLGTLLQTVSASSFLLPADFPSLADFWPVAASHFVGLLVR